MSSGGPPITGSSPVCATSTRSRPDLGGPGAEDEDGDERERVERQPRPRRARPASARGGRLAP
ncbi:hypothetical protein [Actinosynnema sp.]|uniref:hypothetical protein n=1 Tax=Actinosynnema sp. TaxID=1872144 RepID=UPI003F84E05A